METEFAQYLNSGLSRPSFDLLLKKKQAEELAKQEALRQASYDQELMGSSDLGDFQRMLITPKTAEAARPMRMSPQIDMAAQVAQRQAQLEMKDREMRLKEEQARQQMENMKQKSELAGRSADDREALLRNISLPQSPVTAGGKATSYAVPPELQDKLGQYYLTNAILPTQNAPVVPKSFSAGENIPKGELTSPEQVAWDRVLAGNYDKKYSTGEPIENVNVGISRSQQIAQAIAAGMKPEEIKLLFPEDGKPHYETDNEGNVYEIRDGKAKKVEGVKGKVKDSDWKSTQFVDQETGKPIVVDSKGNMRAATVEGNVIPKPPSFTPEAAAKSQLIDQALGYIPSIRLKLFGADGSKKIDRTDIVNIEARTPFTQGRELSTVILDAVEAKLRAESGAAVPESEVKRMAQRFMPQIADKDSTIKIKIDNLEQWLRGTQAKINQGRPNTEQPPKTPQGNAPQTTRFKVKELP